MTRTHSATASGLAATLGNDHDVPAVLRHFERKGDGWEWDVEAALGFASFGDKVAVTQGAAVEVTSEGGGASATAGALPPGSEIAVESVEIDALRSSAGAIDGVSVADGSGIVKLGVKDASGAVVTV